MAGDKKLYWKSLSQFTATVANTEYHVATAWQNNEPIPADRLVYNGVSGIQKPPTSKNAADMKGICVFTAHA